MENCTFRFLEADEYHLAIAYFKGERAPQMDPQFSRVLGAFSTTGELIGFISLQLVAHAEPIFVKPEYRKSGLGLELTQIMDEYCETLGLPGLYVQPTNLAAEKLASYVGFEPADHALWIKLYDKNLESLIMGQGEGE